MFSRLSTISGLRAATAFIVLGLAGQPAFAASDDAWKELWKKSEAACLKASKLNQAKAQSPVDFEASVLRVVTGRYPQPHMKNAAGTVYCLFDKKTGKAEIAEPSAP
ncbi:MAG: hypothetical protein O9322_10465 [Beijerinckiaceae bacterium]|nr:hypothetical protein [Beijerinckiaceae bacterium]MCZ8299756.1 hypothetical protein [Beijerinckiaceae bacterium]